MDIKIFVQITLGVFGVVLFAGSILNDSGSDSGRCVAFAVGTIMLAALIAMILN